MRREDRVEIQSESISRRIMREWNARGTIADTSKRAFTRANIARGNRPERISAPKEMSLCILWIFFVEMVPSIILQRRKQRIYCDIYISLYYYTAFTAFSYTKLRYRKCCSYLEARTPGNMILNICGYDAYVVHPVTFPPTSDISSENENGCRLDDATRRVSLARGDLAPCMEFHLQFYWGMSLNIY